MRIRILHVVDTVAIGGLQNGLAKLVERLDSSRFEHIICSMRPVAQEQIHPFRPGTAQLIRLPDESQFQFSAFADLITRLRPDVVHTRNWGTVEALAAARIFSCGRIHSEHGIDWDTVAAEPMRRVCLRRLAFELAHRVLSVSCHLRDLHARRTGFSKDRITVIHNGVDCKRFAPEPAVRDRVRRELGLASDEFCIGCVGNLIPVKDHLTLLKAVELFSRECDNWKLLIVGEGPEREHLEEAVAALSLERRVCFVGKSNRVPELLNAVDAYLLSSITEGISNSVLEAMATALPVVVTATGGNPEVVEDGVSGLLSPVGDVRRMAGHLRSLYSNAGLRKQFGECAVRRVREQFSVDSMVRQYERLYEEVALRGRAVAHA